MNKKTILHPRNKHRNAYDFPQLNLANPALASFVHTNKYGKETIDFSNPDAVKALNQGLLKHHYGVDFWEIPKDYLCPPVPGRADYLHHIADLLMSSNQGKIPKGQQINCLDIGVGASCIYPIIGVKEYGWSFIGTDVNPIAVEAARDIVRQNKGLKGKVKIRLQQKLTNIFHGIFKAGEKMDLSICNPPFHASPEEAAAGTARKLRNLSKGNASKGNLSKEKWEKAPVLNFGGQQNELFYQGGEKKFVELMIQESQAFGASCFWFSTLISKESNLKAVENMLQLAKVTDLKIVPMAQGNKKSRLVAWTFLTPKQQKVWAETRW